MVSHEVEARNSFLSALEWLMKITLRYANPIQFWLVRITYGNGNQLGEHGAQEATIQLDAVKGSLNKVFGRTDLVCRNGNDFWIIVPYTTTSAEKLYDKVLDVLQSEEHEFLHVVDREASVYSLTENVAELEKQFKEMDALSLLEYLKENKNSFARYMFALPSTAAFS